MASAQIGMKTEVAEFAVFLYSALFHVTESPPSPHGMDVADIDDGTLQYIRNIFSNIWGHFDCVEIMRDRFLPLLVGARNLLRQARKKALKELDANDRITLQQQLQLGL